MKNRMIQTFTASALLASACGSVVAQDRDFSDVEIKPVKVTESIYMLMGSGGNIGLCVGDDGTFMIDDQFAPLTEKILAAIKEITDKPVKFLINTHWHGDHVGGNENINGEGALLVAHENVRVRMSTEQFMKAFDRTVPPSPEAALPEITFTNSMTFHFNGDDIHVFHVPNAHTDGDAIIHFRNDNVIHTGDTFFNGMYPFIDVSTGGRIRGMINAVEQVLKIADDETKIIPGHGPLSNVADLREFRDMLTTVYQTILPMVKQGKNRGEIIIAKPTAALDEKWGNGFMQPDVFVGIVYDSITTAVME